MRYGIKSSWFESMEDELDIELLKQKLIEGAKASADELVKFLRPFAFTRQLTDADLYTGLQAAIQVGADWNKWGEGDEAGLIHATLSRDNGHLLRMPHAFFMALREVGALAGEFMIPPRRGTPNAQIGISDISFMDSKFQCKRIELKNVRASSGGENGTKKSVFKVAGAMCDMTVKIPPSLTPAWKVSMKSANFKRYPSGDIIIDTDADGFQLQQLPQTVEEKPVQEPESPQGR